MDANFSSVTWAEILEPIHRRGLDHERCALRLEASLLVVQALTQQRAVTIPLVSDEPKHQSATAAPIGFSGREKQYKDPIF
jgi:hypothetical protein